MRNQISYKNRIVKSQLDRELLKLIEKQNISAKTFNIYYFGGSSMYGDPYAPQLTIPKLVEYILGHKIGGRDIRSINVARCGKNFGCNLIKLKQILENKELFHPSLCVIYSGHNEYAENVTRWGFSSRRCYLPLIERLKKYFRSANEVLCISKFKFYKLGIDGRKYFDVPIYEQKKYKEIIQKYYIELENAIHLLGNNHIPVVISTVAGNYSGWEPNRSVFWDNESKKGKFKQLMESGRKAEVETDFRQAIKFYQRALSLSQNFAETHYRLGKSYEAIGQYEQAWEEYQKAVEYDGMPIRTLSAQNNFIRKLAQTNSAHIVDTVEYLRKHTSHGIIGFNLMIDGQHPNLKGYILISELIAKKIQDIFYLEPIKINYMDEKRAMELFGIDSSKLFEIYTYEGVWFYHLATWRYDPTERLKLSENFFLKALTLVLDHYKPYLGLAVVNFLRKDVFKANEYLSKAKKINSNKVEKYLRQDWLRSVIKRATLLNPDKLGNNKKNRYPNDDQTPDSLYPLW